MLLHCSVFSRNTTKVHHSTPGLWNQLSLYQNILPTNNWSSFKIKTSGSIFRFTWLRISTTSVTKCTRGAGFLIKYENSTQIFQWLIPLFSVLDKLSVEDDNSEIVCCECDDYLQDEKKWAPLAQHLSLPHHLLQLLLWVEYFYSPTSVYLFLVHYIFWGGGGVSITCSHWLFLILTSIKIYAWLLHPSQDVKIKLMQPEVVRGSVNPVELQPAATRWE